MNAKPPQQDFVPYQGYSDLHCATERQLQSRWTVVGYDRGELTLRPQRVVFRGMRGGVECPEVTSVGWAKKAFPWPVAILVGLAALAAAGLTAPGPLSWKQPLPYVVLAILLNAGLQQFRERWIEVAYREGGALRRIYFRREPVFGFGSSRKRTEQLYNELREKVLTRDGPSVS